MKIYIGINEGVVKIIELITQSWALQLMFGVTTAGIVIRVLGGAQHATPARTLSQEVENG